MVSTYLSLTLFLHFYIPYSPHMFPTKFIKILLPHVLASSLIYFWDTIYLLVLICIFILNL